MLHDTLLCKHFHGKTTKLVSLMKVNDTVSGFMQFIQPWTSTKLPKHMYIYTYLYIPDTYIITCIYIYITKCTYTDNSYKTHDALPTSLFS